jgi:uncharacterized protein DUF6353
VKFKPKFAAKHVGRMVQQNSPTLLSAVAVVGVAATGYFTFKATWKAKELVQEEDNHRIAIAAAGDTVPSTLTAQEIGLKVWKLYIPAMCVGSATIGCIVASNRIQVRRLAAMAAAYGVLSGDFDEYRNKALEMLGDKKSKAIDDKIAEKKMHENPPPKDVVVAEGKAWFCDLSTMRYLQTDRQAVEHAVNQLNYMLLHSGNMYATLNNFYAFLGLPSTNVGDRLGWTNEQQVEFIPSPVLMEDGSSATGIKLAPEPAPDFDDLH